MYTLMDKAGDSRVRNLLLSRNIHHITPTQSWSAASEILPLMSPFNAAKYDGFEHQMQLALLGFTTTVFRYLAPWTANYLQNAANSLTLIP